MLKNFIFLTFILIFFNVNGQDSNIIFDHLTIDHGLSHNSVSTIFQDSKGFLWFGTGGGLNKYDGYTFERKNSYAKDTNSPINNLSNLIFEDKNGLFWLGSDFGYTVYYPNTNTFSKHLTYTIANKAFHFSHIHNILQDSEGNIWFSQDKALVKLNVSTNQYSKYDFKDGIIVKIVMSTQGIFYIGGSSGLYTFNPIHSAPKIECITSNLQIKAMEKLPKENGVLLASKQGIYTYKFTTGKLIKLHFRLHENILKETKCLASHANKIYLGTLYGLVVCTNGASRIFKNDIGNEGSLSANSVNAILIDKAGLVWIGTSHGGINIIDKQKHRFLSIKNTPNGYKTLKNVYALIQDRMGRIWVSTHEYGITILDSNRSLVLKNSAKENNISKWQNGTILEIKPGTVWVASWNMGITEINETKPNNFNYKWIRNYANDPKSLKGWSIRHMIKSKFSGDIWICSYDAGLEKYDVQNNRFIHYSFEPDSQFYIPHKKIWCLMEDHIGNIWVGTQEGGVFMLDIINKKVKQYGFDIKNPHGLASVSIRSLYEAKNGVIWIGHSGAGLDKLNRTNGKITNYSENDGLCNDVIWSITEDKQEKIWVSTDNGISRLDVQNKTFINFNTSDGLQGVQFNHASYNKTQKDELMYGGINGISIIDPMKFEMESFVPPVLVTNLKLYNTYIKPGMKWENRIILLNPIYNADELHLTYKDKVFSLEFAALDYANPEKIKYAYMMEGFDNEWITTKSDKREATYTNLPEGTYVFKVKATNSDGVWNPIPTEINVIIDPPFWRTWWFRAILILVAIIISAVFYWYRVYTIKKQNTLLRNLVNERTEEINRQNLELLSLNATKDKFFSIISHDLKNPFQAIMTLTDLLMVKYRSYNDEQRFQFLGQIKISSEKAFNLLQNLLYWAQTQTGSITYEPQNLDLAAVIDQCVSLYKINSDKKNIQFFLHLEKHTIVAADENMIATVIRNLISNAIKFTPENGIIEVILYSENDNAKVEIKDSGVGVSDDVVVKLFKVTQHITTPGTNGETGSGLGLMICKEFIEKNAGELFVYRNETGSTFGFTLPLILQNKDTTLPPQDGNNVSFKNNVNDAQKKENEISKKTLVIVEDSAEILQSLTTYLNDHYLIHAANNGRSGLDLIRKYSPDLIISDIMMPEMDGFELCSRVKSDSFTSHIPVILLTAQAQDENQQKGLEQGADDYIIKPFNAGLLEARIHNLIKNRTEIKKRFQSELKLQPKDIIISAIDGDFLKKAIEIIENNIDNSNFDIEFFTKEMGVGRTQFYEKIKHLSDLTPAEFIRMIRLKRAAQLMHGSSKTISEIMYQVGINDMKNFRKLFKAQFGVTPTEYIKNKK